MARQETYWEEACCASGIPTREQAYDMLPEMRERYPEWSGFTVEYEMTAQDYIDQHEFDEEAYY